MKLLTVRDLKETMKFLDDDDVVFLRVGSCELHVPYLYTSFIVKEGKEYVEAQSDCKGVSMALIIQ